MSKNKKERWELGNLEMSHPLQALNPKQKLYIEAVRNNPTVITLGTAGTGKTFIAASIAAEMLIRHRINKIILTRPMVAVGKSAGLLPGTLDEKLEPWFRPLIDVLVDKMGQPAYDCHRKNGNIEFSSFEQMQGRSFHDAFIILDEAQNCTPFELKMFLTRLGENTKTVIDGDIRQTCLKEASGLKTVVEMVNRYKLPLPMFEFNVDEIVRSDQCAMWIGAFEAMEDNLPRLQKSIVSRIQAMLESERQTRAA